MPASGFKQFSHFIKLLFLLKKWLLLPPEKRHTLLITCDPGAIFKSYTCNLLKFPSKVNFMLKRRVVN